MASTKKRTLAASKARPQSEIERVIQAILAPLSSVGCFVKQPLKGRVMISRERKHEVFLEMQFSSGKCQAQFAGRGGA